MLNKDYNHFINRHIGIDQSSLLTMLSTLSLDSTKELIQQTIPNQILKNDPLQIPEAMSEFEFLKHIQGIADRNKLVKTYIGQGYYGTITPSVILRNIFHNPGWYTQYTPYQAEISQGRMEALMNFQTVVSDLTALPIANASLLDEGTAAAESMAMFFSVRNKRTKEPVLKYFVDRHVFQQTKDIIRLRAEPLHIEVVEGDWQSFTPSPEFFGACIQYPDAQGLIHNYENFTSSCKEHQIYVTAVADLMSLVLITPPGEWGADACVGTTQRFGIPIGYGGPHAAYFATKEDFKRQIPGRIIGVSIDRQGDTAYRMALQTREQHIKREKATSNICTAQALLAVMAGMYAVYHGADGLHQIATRIHAYASLLRDKVDLLGFKVVEGEIFDTITIEVSDEEKQLIANANINVFAAKDACISISIDETTTFEDIEVLVSLFSTLPNAKASVELESNMSFKDIVPEFERQSSFLDHPVFNMYHSETEMMRYIKRLENKDLSLMHAMIPLGSCTMKLNAATQLFPVSIPEFANLHPFCPADQSLGYQYIFSELEKYLSEITGFHACSLQPNSGAQGEYAGLMVIRAYHKSRGDDHRNIVLIPSSAHGTNPASAIMAGMKVVVVKCDDLGNIDVDDLKTKVEEHKANLSALMVTYPSTHGVFEEDIQEICRITHDCGGKVYMDGANMNAQVGLTSPGIIGADVCHLNLHKTFAIPHGGGGPGMGPICVNESLAPFLPGHYSLASRDTTECINAVSAAPFGSASILLISYAYIRLLGPTGLKMSTEIAILNANYIKERLKNDYEVLYLGKKGRTAHELILDLRPYKSIGVSAEDVAKRLMDYGFHAPTLSFPVAGTIMIEPTESENIRELDRFCDAMLSIKEEINEIARGDMSADSSTLSNAPYTLKIACADEWPYAYSREKALFPLASMNHSGKFWPSVARVDNAHGDRNLVCTCPPLEDYA